MEGYLKQAQEVAAILTDPQEKKQLLSDLDTIH